MEIINLKVDITPHIILDEYGVHPIKFSKDIDNFKIKEINIHVDNDKIVREIYVPNVFHPQLHVIDDFMSIVKFKIPPKNSRTCHVVEVTGKKFNDLTEERLTYLFLVHDYSGASTLVYRIPEEFYTRV